MTDNDWRESAIHPQNPAYKDTVSFLFSLINTYQSVKKRIRNIIKFIKIDIWHVMREDVSPIRFFIYNIIKKLALAIERFTAKGMINSASALTYSTLLAIVPILAVVFAVARGFGYNKYIEIWFRDTLSSQPQVAETIIGFVNSYLVHTKRGLFLGIGLVFMLWTVIMLISNVEQTFNNIWQVKKPRSMFRTVTDYVSMILLVPIVIVITSGFSIFITTLSGQMNDFIVLAPIMRFFIDLIPFILMSAVFISLFVFMPNTKVKFSCAIVPGILAGVAMQGLQMFYIHSQIWVSSYNAIYGSFAVLPLFMLWVQISWTICLFCAELCYSNQNLEDYAFKAQTEDISHRYHLMLSVVLASHICKRFNAGEKPYTALDLKIITGIPIRIVNDLLYELSNVNIITEVMIDEKGEECRYQPAESTERLSVGTIIDRLESRGKWTVDLDLHNMGTTKWRDVIKSRNDYLEKQRLILLKDL